MLKEKIELSHRDLISVSDLSREEISLILEISKQIKTDGFSPFLEGKVLASCFFEPSTRTRLSFESAMLRSGGKVIGFTDPVSTSSNKGESLQDTMRVISAYSDLIVIRHSAEGAARCSSLASNVPVINAGDGSNQHPTQTLTDLFTIWETHGTLDNLNIALVGDLRYGRTVHSLTTAATLFGVRLFFVSPPSLSLPDSYLDLLHKRGVKYSLHESIEEVIDRTDVLYMTRLQWERIPESKRKWMQQDYTLYPKLLEQAKPQLKILHPLPRLDEIPTAVDHSPHAHYFEQSANSLFVRAALLGLLSKTLPGE